MKAPANRQLTTVCRRELMCSGIYFPTKSAAMLDACSCGDDCLALSRILFQRMLEGQRFLFAEPIQQAPIAPMTTTNCDAVRPRDSISLSSALKAHPRLANQLAELHVFSSSNAVTRSESASAQYVRMENMYFICPGKYKR
ncbi:hypothetical protein [Massilia sp. IC2-476]|uniref:hypothetical protein n=1 Tax=Massilia sp. IC2-476 TaxID=2887199 RepID=UPI001D125C95|nr:hypothetical protein [Massilia sp. IC2-476]MCC2974270.1 hypothetical protein [Massilia sp. IC2-476]